MTASFHTHACNIDLFSSDSLFLKSLIHHLDLRKPNGSYQSIRNLCSFIVRDECTKLRQDFPDLEVSDEN